jgi:hypothetical protein
MSPGDHFLDLEGARLVNACYFALTQRNIAAVIKHRALSVVTGPAGTGKTTAMNYAARQHGGIKLELVGTPSPYVIVNGFLRVLTGVPHDETAQAGAELLIELLCERSDDERFLYVDEVQLNESLRNVEFVRRIAERSRTPTVLVGGEQMKARIAKSPQIVRRVFRPTFFEGLPIDQILDVIPKMHPIYHGVSKKLLPYVDSRCGDGNLGNWAKFSVEAVDLSEERGKKRLTRDIADEAIRRLGGFTA